MGWVKFVPNKETEAGEHNVFPQRTGAGSLCPGLGLYQLSAWGLSPEKPLVLPHLPALAFQRKLCPMCVHVPFPSSFLIVAPGHFHYGISWNSLRACTGEHPGALSHKVCHPVMCVMSSHRWVNSQKLSGHPEGLVCDSDALPLAITNIAYYVRNPAGETHQLSAMTAAPMTSGRFPVLTSHLQLPSVVSSACFPQLDSWLLSV